MAALAMAVSGCAPPPADPPAPGYRDRTVPMGSPALFDPVAFGGGWRLVAATPAGPFAGCSELAFGPGTAAALCGDGWRQGGARMDLPGRYALDMGDAPINFWVMWVDEGGRSAVVGAPDGSWAAILDRQGAIPPDRRTAAREVLDFNGFNADAVIDLP